jgi:acyl-CoA synthetase (AMP-forming)/AMP-acid ligase II
MQTVNLADVIDAVAHRQPTATAFTDSHGTLTYAGFMDRSAACAAQFAESGVTEGQRIGLAMQRDVDALAAMVGCWLIGAVAAPLDFRTRRQQRADICRDLGLHAVAESRPAAGAGDDYPVLKLDPGAGSPGRRRLRGLTGEHPALISLTSGTTGRPAGIVLSHAAQYCRLAAYRESYPTHPATHLLNIYPTGFSASRNLCLLTLINGGRATILPPLSSAAEVADAIDKRGVTLFYAVPPVLEAMLALPVDRSFTTIETLGLGSGFSRPELKRQAFERLTPKLVEVYSASISGGISMLAGEDILTHGDTVGRPLMQSLVDIAGDGGDSAAAGETGAVRVRAPGMAEAVIGAEGRALSDRVVDGWVWTGDLGALRADGFLELRGRASDLIIRGGANVYPEEVERVLAGHPSVREVAVVGVPHPTLGEDVVAFVCGETDAASLDAFCLARLNSDKRPREFVVVGSLPRNANGKVMRGELRDLYASRAVGEQ